jgi:hypothetical protein
MASAFGVLVAARRLFHRRIPAPPPLHRAEPRRLALRRKSFGPDMKLLREASTK